MAMRTATMGVDPGVRGAVAVLDSNGRPVYLQPFMPEFTEKETVEYVRLAVHALRDYGGSECFYEKVGFKRGDGGQGAFTFGHIDGLIRGALLTLGVQPLYVFPAMWQSALECLTGGQKNVSKQKAIALFPSIKITHAVADALLIAEYGRRRSLIPL